MKTRVVSAMVVVLFGVSMLSSALKAQSDINLTGYTLSFDDEFNSVSATTSSPKGSTIWYAQPLNGYGYYSESQWDISSFSSSGGVLSDKAFLDPSNNWHSGELLSVDPTGTGFSQTYGYFEVRCQMPSSGTGAWPAFWLDTTSAIASSVPNEEIDIFEWYGTEYTNNQGQVQQTTHNWNTDGSQNTSVPYLPATQVTLPGGALPWQGYHIYGCQIDPVHVTWYIDGVQTNQIATPASYINSPFFVELDYAIGGGWPLSGMVNNSSFNVDWVRVYSLPSSSGVTGTPFVSGQSTGMVRNDFTGPAGLKFTVGSSPLTINALGRWVISGNTGAHTVELVQASNQTVVASVSVPTTGATAGAFTYANLSALVTLSANTAYYLLSQETEGGDQWYSDDTAITTTGVATINGSEYYQDGSYRVGNYSNSSHSYVPVSFAYQPPSGSSGTAFVTGQTVGTARNDWTGAAGLKFTVGSSPLTINSLGRWVVSGNTGTHTVELVQASNQTVVASVAVPTSGATAGAFAYASLSSPVTLSANTAYYLLSMETDGGDQWYQDDTTLATTGVATINNSEFYQDGTYNMGNYTNSPHSYVPVSFTYQSTGAGGTAFVTGQTTGTVRNDWTGIAGLEMTVGSSPLTVKSLGRWVVSGNTGTHTVELVQASTQTVMASVSVPTAGAPAGAFTYATLATPVTLSANTAYYLVSQETEGGDQWYQDDTTLTTTSAATINNSEYYQDGAYHVGNYSNLPHSYVPVSFTY